MTDKELILKFFDGLRAQIIALQSEKGIKASGASAGALDIQQPDDTTTQLIDPLGYFQFQEEGRGATRSSSSSGQSLQQRIYEWMQYKSFSFANEKQHRSLSYAIANTIHKHGTLTHRLGQRTGVLSEVLNNINLSPLAQALADKYSQEFLSDVLKEFRF